MAFKKKIPPYPFKEYPIMQQPALVPTFGQQAQIDRKFGMFLHFGINTFKIKRRRLLWQFWLAVAPVTSAATPV